ncbi:MAG: radical SAM protein [Deltaproteobacteria bacterium]|nr:radical SAM protein [Deltaproteobacteria bacterium]
MELSGLHFLLTYKCTYECDHCFVWGSPDQSGVFTLAQLEDVFQQALDLGTVREMYFEGGEPFLYHPILLHAVARAHALGFWTGIVSNGYWATTVDDAAAWLRPLMEAGLDSIDVSRDELHGLEPDTAGNAVAAAERLSLEVSPIAIEAPTGYCDPAGFEPGAPITGGGVRYRGRAAENLVEGLPRLAWESFDTCPWENLTDPGRVHVDPLGYLHLCQGVVIGNLFENPLKEIVAAYDPAAHPVVGPLLEGGPVELVRRYGLAHEEGYVDACHLCYRARVALRERFPEVLAPGNVYGEMSE